ncbi:MAG: hypothetical protein SO016_03290 [Lachnospiraceae bacterium]|nr:hypothetical protein [Robinsoniella sp.]MDY3765709.1 hypothetical protein [Lachnospiraceae bacterium]
MKKRMVLLCSALALCGCCSAIYAEEATAPSLSVESNIYGSAFTHGKTGLVVYATNTQVEYAEDSQAIFTLVLPDGSPVDDSLIDCSNASVTLTDGDGYYTGEYAFHKTALDGKWENGQYVYRLDAGDLVMNLDTYPYPDLESVREMSSLGGDGSGNYYLNLTVSGIVYDGVPVEDQTFRIHIFIFGRDYRGDANTLYGEEGTPAIEAEFARLDTKTDALPDASSLPAWTWIGEGDKPILCDHLADDFYITWPSGSDASAITSSDVRVTLYSQYGDALALTGEEDFQVQSSEDETQIALIYQNWPFMPVYNTMTIEVDGPDGSIAQSYDIGSVYAYEAQQGGSGSVSIYSFYGLANLTSWDQIMSPAICVLSITDENGQTLYYAEDENGVGYTTDDITKAMQFDASGEEDRNQKLAVNSVFISKLNGQTEDKVVGDETITFTKTTPGKDSGIDAGGGLLSPLNCDPSLEPAPGYVIPWGTENWITNEKWSWQANVNEGWEGLVVTPFVGHYKWEAEASSQVQFQASFHDEEVKVDWVIASNVDEGTSISEDGLLTIAPDESHATFSIRAIAEDGTLGAVNITVKK